MWAEHTQDARLKGEIGSLTAQALAARLPYLFPLCIIGQWSHERRGVLVEVFRLQILCTPSFARAKVDVRRWEFMWAAVVIFAMADVVDQVTTGGVEEEATLAVVLVRHSLRAEGRHDTLYVKRNQHECHGEGTYTEAKWTGRLDGDGENGYLDGKLRAEWERGEKTFSVAWMWVFEVGRVDSLK